MVAGSPDLGGLIRRLRGLGLEALLELKETWTDDESRARAASLRRVLRERGRQI